MAPDITRACALPPWTANAPVTPDGRWRAHDLLKLRRLPELPGEPAWVRSAFARAPFAVVRRAESAAGFVAIGVRGAERNARYGTWAEAADIEAVIAPEDLAGMLPTIDRAPYPVYKILNAVRQTRCLSAFIWGPTGSAGFELATGLPTVTSSSDLDLLVRTPTLLSMDTARALLDELTAHATRAGTRIDVQLETPAGGVALAEFASTKARVLARSAQGPRLVADPWATAEAHAQEST
ncbi:malonate decarboxylase holo-ACP synthase [Trinickia violacea]|uniref:Malonate decarboxylase holo-ACP synthase n=1 Tax=Trinickia violacea TaxID=2571746 RepID=A0A4P8J001_9BURK|nr:malonate decarboxylase holo-ACP synthase [Trinickia violacea]QCP54972.1 malonate decarboxylase holo-ACP synthase [Trinickia violacea]